MAKNFIEISLNSYLVTNKEGIVDVFKRHVSQPDLVPKIFEGPAPEDDEMTFPAIVVIQTGNDGYPHMEIIEQEQLERAHRNLEAQKDGE